jgi:DNA-binding response OmpR family regulator
MSAKYISTLEKPAGAPAASPAYRILVVDDDPLICQLNTEVLIAAGYHVDAAGDGDVAWDALQLINYDLLITDNNMPKVSGINLLKRIYAAQMEIRTIMATGRMPDAEFAAHPWLQPTALLLKPYTIAEILDTVEKVLNLADSTTARPLEMMEQQAPQAGMPTMALAAHAANSSRRILVVDDDDNTRQISIAVLAGSGYNVVSAQDGAAGWESLQTYDYDLVITDNKMPRMTGVEMIGKLRSANMAVPVIMATGCLPLEEFARKPWLKPEAMLERPFSNEDLLASVKNLLGTDPGNAGFQKNLVPKYL